MIFHMPCLLKFWISFVLAHVTLRMWSWVFSSPTTKSYFVSLSLTANFFSIWVSLTTDFLPFWGQHRQPKWPLIPNWTRQKKTGGLLDFKYKFGVFKTIFHCSEGASKFTEPLKQWWPIIYAICPKSATIMNFLKCENNTTKYLFKRVFKIIKHYNIIGLTMFRLL